MHWTFLFKMKLFQLLWHIFSPFVWLSEVKAKIVLLTWRKNQIENFIKSIEFILVLTVSSANWIDQNKCSESDYGVIVAVEKLN